ncbi:MAG: hypothetical protein D6B28_11150 [Gammaproteobacteria bacterium]|nr:MAG: hypothetical protein D6B28_11150 [Gammaproteobacteria bacterium]
MLTLNKHLVLTLLLLSYSVSSSAVDGLNLHGYVTQGFIHSSGNNYLTDSTSGSFDFGEAGLSFSYRPLDRVFMSAQISTNNIGDHESGEDDLRLDYGLVSFNIAAGNTYEADLRVGKFKYFYGMFNDIQDIPNAIPGVLPPQSIYFEYFYPELATNGFLINQSWRNPDLGSLKVDIMYGLINDEREKQDSTYDALILKYPALVSSTGVVSLHDGVGGIRLEYLSPDNSLLISYSHLVSDGVQTITAHTNEWDYKEIADMYLDSLSLEYVADRWTLTGEYVTKKVFGSVYAKYLPWDLIYWDFKTEVRSEAFYLQYRYQLTERFEPLIRYEAYYYNKCDRDGSKYEEDNSLNKGYYFYSEAYVIGGSYKFNDKLTLNAEFQVYDGAALNAAAGAVGDPYNRLADGFDRYWNMFLLDITYSF